MGKKKSQPQLKVTWEHIEDKDGKESLERAYELIFRSSFKTNRGRGKRGKQSCQEGKGL